MEYIVTAERYHDICCGHRVVGHENKCKHLHGHNYRFHFKIASTQDLDHIGRVVDFSVIKSTLCQWLEDNFDHKFLIWEHDPYLADIKKISPESLYITSFNPTAENIAKYICEEVAIDCLSGTGCVLVECKIEETRKCSVTYKIDKK